jgi:hypothetical protein
MTIADSRNLGIILTTHHGLIKISGSTFKIHPEPFHYHSHSYMTKWTQISCLDYCNKLYNRLNHSLQFFSPSTITFYSKKFCRSKKISKKKTKQTKQQNFLSWPLLLGMAIWLASAIGILEKVIQRGFMPPTSPRKYIN